MLSSVRRGCWWKSEAALAGKSVNRCLQKALERLIMCEILDIKATARNTVVLFRGPDAAGELEGAAESGGLGGQWIGDIQVQPPLCGTGTRWSWTCNLDECELELESEDKGTMS